MPFLEVIPAIDIRGGKCVRLYQGDFTQETVFSDDPVAVAQRWASLGAPRLHVVDLDGAAAGAPQNLPLVQRIVESVAIPVQLGGGLRTLEAIGEVLGMGVQRAVLGTAALEDRGLVWEARKRFGEAILVAVDARHGKVATHGWLQQSEATVADVVRQCQELGATRFLRTDITRDGTLRGVDTGSLSKLVQLTRGRLLVSGGVASLEDLRELAALGVEGAVLGRSLYTEAIKLEEALEAVREQG